MAEGDHRHCKECGKVCAPDREFCSARCRERREEKLRNRRQLSYLFYAAIAVFAVLFVLSFFRV